MRATTTTLHCEMPIGFATAALGREIETPTLDGATKLRIPHETQSGKVFRQRGKDIRNVRSGHPSSGVFQRVSVRLV